MPLLTTLRKGHLEKCPQTIAIDNLKQQSLTFGDMHGNAIKLIYLLIENGVMNLNESNYNHLNEIYKKQPHLLTPNDLEKFDSILHQARFHECGLIRLIGDELADRGNNDLFTLYILRVLHHHNIPFEIILSNHGIVALYKFDQNDEERKRCIIGVPGFSMQISADNMWACLSKDNFEHIKKDALSIANHIYKPHLRLIGYHIASEQYGKQELTLFTHAPIGLETVRALAEQLGIPYEDDSIEHLVNCINKMNEKISQLIALNQLRTLYNPEITSSGPFHQIFWARQLPFNFTLKPQGHFVVNVVHGHVGPDHLETYHENLTNLDGYYGKGPTLSKGYYFVLIQTV